mgnify:FL=1
MFSWVIERYFPLIDNFKKYKRQDFIHDLIAGCTVSVIFVPQAIAYALLMGVPPVYGLFGGLIPLMIYALMGRAFPLSIGPVAISSILIFSGISQIAEPFSDEYIALVITAGLFIGLIKWLMGFFRLGFLVNFISLPVISGFISASAMLIIFTQLKDALGISIPLPLSSLDLFIYIPGHLNEINFLTFGIFCVSLILLIFFRKWNQNFPSTLIILAFFTLLTFLFRWDKAGVAIVGDIPSGLPGFALPLIGFESFQKLLPTIFTVTFISIVECMSIGRTLEMKSGKFKLEPGKELKALGISKMIGAFFQSPPTSASFSRSVLNESSGAKSGVSSLITSGIIAISLLLFTPLFTFIPKAVLAAVIIITVAGLIDIQHAFYLWQVKRRELLVLLFTFSVTLIFGIDEGVLTGIILSFAIIIYYSSRPQIVELGNIPGTTHYRNIDRFHKARQVRDYLIIRFDDQLYFGNANYFRDTIIKMLETRKIPPKFLLLDASTIHDMDSTGLYSLKEIYDYLKKMEIQLIISGATGPIRDLLKRSGLMDTIGSQNHFMYIKNAVRLSEEEKEDQWLPEAVQYNERKNKIFPIRNARNVKDKPPSLD